MKINEVAKKKGITSGYQLQKLTGFAPAMAERVYNGNWTRIDLKTLNTICSVLKCTPNDILHFTPDRDDH